MPNRQTKQDPRPYSVYYADTVSLFSLHCCVLLFGQTVLNEYLTFPVESRVGGVSDRTDDEGSFFMHI